MNKNPYILCQRGVSGSGKSTQIKKLMLEYRKQYSEFLYPVPHHYEADDWFTRDNGDYFFDANELSRAHMHCLLSTEYAIRVGATVFVSNTFTRRSELKPYIELALKYQIPLVIKETDTEWCRDPFECARRNVHKVPLETIQKQLARWEHVIPKEYSGKALEKLLRECSK